MRKRSYKIVDTFEAATRAHEMRGAMPPEEWSDIDWSFKTAKHVLESYIDHLKAQIVQLKQEKWEDKK